MKKIKGVTPWPKGDFSNCRKTDSGDIISHNINSKESATDINRPQGQTNNPDVIPESTGERTDILARNEDIEELVKDAKYWKNEGKKEMLHAIEQDVKELNAFWGGKIRDMIPPNPSANHYFDGFYRELDGKLARYKEALE